MLLDLQTAFDFAEQHKVAILFHLTFIFGLSIWALSSSQASLDKENEEQDEAAAAASKGPELKGTPSIMSGFAPKEEVKLAPPKDDPITKAELAKCDGQDPSKPIYVAIKGTIFDVSAKKEMYGPGAGYNIFAGKDASRGLGKSSLSPEDAVSDYSTLTAEEMGVLNDWFTYFSKRYNVVGKVAE